MSRFHPLPIGAAACAAAIVLLAPASQATRVTTPAVSICHPALPSFEGQIRKRPLAIQNEGAQAAFVTCAFSNPGYNNGTHRINSISIQAQNANSASRTLACTAVNSSASDAPAAPLYLGGEVSVPGNGRATLDFAAADFPGAPVVLPGDTIAVSCELRPGVGITGTVLVNNAG